MLEDRSDPVHQRCLPHGGEGQRPGIFLKQRMTARLPLAEFVRAGLKQDVPVPVGLDAGSEVPWIQHTPIVNLEQCMSNRYWGISTAQRLEGL